MSSGETAPQTTPAASAEAGQGNLLDQVLAATKQTERSRAEDLVRTLAEEVTKGTVTWNKNVSQTINAGIQALDALLSKQLAAILHNQDFQKVESSWRGLN